MASQIWPRKCKEESKKSQTAQTKPSKKLKIFRIFTGEMVS